MSATETKGAWLVRVTVCGVAAGCYFHDTEEQAESDAAERRRKFGVLGCRYVVEGPLHATTIPLYPEPQGDAAL